MRANSFTRFGLAVAALTCLLDQASKVYLLKVVDLAANGPLRMGPFFDFVLTRNTGISYGMFQTEGALGQAVLLAVKALAVVLLWVWMTRSHNRLTALSLGLIIGGAVGNAIDRLAYGAVFDFIHIHVGSFSWYVFNVADAAIVAGVVGLLYDSFVLEQRRRA